MSAVKLAMRIAAVEALKSAGTLVGDDVFDSRIAPFDVTAKGSMSTKQPRPFVVVYTDASKASLDGSTGPRANGMVDITFIIAVAASMATTNKETGEREIVTGIAATDEYLEAMLDVIGVQILRALVDEANPWAQAYRGFVRSDEVKEETRVNSADGSGRLAAAQIKLTVSVFADPPAGQVLAEGSPWAQLFALMEAGGMVKPLALLQGLLDGTPGAVTVEKLTGMTGQDAEALILHDVAGVSAGTLITGAGDNDITSLLATSPPVYMYLLDEGGATITDETGAPLVFG